MGRIQKIYDKIIMDSTKFGTYHKCLFHLHTPASGNDYATLEKFRKNIGDNVGKGKQQISHDELVQLCEEKNLFPKGSYDSVVNKLFEANKTLYINIDEMLKYLLIAWEMIINKIELSVISDHNVIDGYEPLNRAIAIIHDNFNDIIKRNGFHYPILLLGVEISCADKNHVVGIFDYGVEDNVKHFIEEYIMSPQDGTFLASMAVIEEISKLGGIAYIAHTDTSDMFKGKFSSNAYTKTLLNLPELRAIGFSYKLEDRERSRDRVKKYIKERTDKEFAFLLDADSHSIDTIKDRCFYIKGHKCNFHMIKEAILDNDIAICFDMPQDPECYMKGVYIINKSNRGFLIAPEKANEESFFVPLSTSLNCLIGGRGTGKSTILNIIEAVLGQSFLDENVLNSIFEYDEIWILYSYQGTEYLIGFFPEVPKYSGDSAYDNFQRICNEERLFYWDLYRPKNNLLHLKNRILKDCIQIFKVENGIEFKEVGKRILREFYDMSYSVNELVKTASSEEINEYIYKIIGMNPKLKGRRTEIKNEEDLRRFLNTINQRIKKRKEDILDKISGFNNSVYATGKIRIKYDIEDKNNDRFRLGDIFDKYKLVTRINGVKYIDGTNLSLDGAIGFLSALNKKCGNVNFAKMILDEALLDDGNLLLKYTTPLSSEMTNNNITVLNNENKNNVLVKINKYILDKKIENIIDGFGDNYIRDIECFSLEFNVMNKEGENKRPLYRDVRQLSLGQKVVTMLSFVLGYSDYINDYRPLVIDQPEDNLDNQYVFKNLVYNLRKIRGKRQIIIATHSATIVTNAKAEQVIVMKSDGEHGWITDKGYVTENRIKRHIINYMEGGVESFKHKMNIYKDVLG